MAAETKSIRDNTRRLKDLAIKRAIDILENPGAYDKDVVEATFLKVIGNAVPRTQEITGEDGGAVQVSISEAIARKNGILINAAPNDTNSISEPNS